MIRQLLFYFVIFAAGFLFGHHSAKENNIISRMISDSSYKQVTEI